MKDIKATSLQVASGTFAILDRLARALVEKKVLSRKEADQIVKGAIGDLRKCGDPTVQSAADFLRDFYKARGRVRAKKK
ncbi:MAG: hypothetical protein ACLQME_07090 [Alphaproteobacteria bacterium]